jgi:acid phosphatase
MRSAVPRSRRTQSWVAVFLAAALLVGCGGEDGSKAAPAVDGVRVAVVVFESPLVADEGWLADAAEAGGRARNAHGETNPSFGNYLAMLSGSTQGVSDDDITHGPYDEPTLVGQLEEKGVSWKAYHNAMPGPCWDLEGEHDEYGRYAKRHNPFLFFAEVIDDKRFCARHVVPGTQLPKDMATGDLPQFVWITPDLCQQAHDPDCATDAAERYMREDLPPLIEALGPKGLLIVTSDEDTKDRKTIPMVTLGPLAKPGATMDTEIDHRALLATIEDLLGVGRLKTTEDAPTLASLLRG